MVLGALAMARVIEYSDSDELRWRDFVENCPTANIAHLPGWRNVIESGLGHKPRYFCAVDGDRIVGVLPLFLIKTWTLSRYLVSIPWIDYGGICADNLEAEQLLISKAREIAKTDRAKYIELRSVDINSSLVDTPNLFLRRDKVSFILDLNDDPDLVMKKFNGKLRNQIRKAQKSGLITEFAGVEKLADFYRIFAWRMRALGTPVWGVKFFEAILKTYSSTARLALVRKDDKFIAAALVLSFKNQLYVPSAASYTEYLRYCPNQALYWDIIKNGCEQGYRYFDFGRSTWNSPTFNFKKQWVPTPLQLTWQYYLNTAKTPPDVENGKKKYAPLMAIWRKLPLPVANLLGPKVVKNFP
jgi:FemAB-related protein (PEP-CTERM system-associated)